jgi:hypothetical protein
MDVLKMAKEYAFGEKTTYKELVVIIGLLLMILERLGGSNGRDEVWDALQELARQNHKDRVSKNPDRIAYAIQQFEAHGIEYQLKNSQTGHFHCWRKSDDKLFQFYAGTGKIQGLQTRGIHNLIKLLEG